MRISELSRVTAIPVATVKYYLRERLLHEGTRTSATQARYDKSHVVRLNLIRALVGPGGLSIARAHEVLEAIDHPPESVHDLLGVAAAAVSRPARQRDHDRVHALMKSWGWQVDDKDCTTHDELAAALDGLDAAEFAMPDDLLDLFAAQLAPIAEAEFAAVPTESPTAAVRHVVLGTVLVEPVMLALRRMAQQQASIRRFADGPEDTAEDTSDIAEGVQQV